MNLIHETLCLSGYNNVSYVHNIGNWWNRNFYSTSVKNFQCELPKTGPMIVPSGKAAKTGFRKKIENSSIPGNFVLLKILEVSFFRIIVNCTLPASSSKLKTFFSHPVSSCYCRKRYQQFHFFWLHHGHFFIHKNSDSSSFCLSSQFHKDLFATAPWTLSWLTEWTVWNKSSVFIDSPLKWMALLPLFCFKSPRLKALILLTTRWPVSLNRCTFFVGCRLPFSFMIVRRSYTPLFFRSWTQETFHVLVRTSLRNSWPFQHSNYNSHHSFTIQSHSTLRWRWSSPWTPRAGGSFFPSLVGHFLKKIQWWNPVKFFHPNSNCFSIDTHCILVRRSNLSPFHLTVPFFYCFWTVFHLSDT